jgi:hypothetical protein
MNLLYKEMLLKKGDTSDPKFEKMNAEDRFQTFQISPKETQKSVRFRGEI